MIKISRLNTGKFFALHGFVVNNSWYVPAPSHAHTQVLINDVLDRAKLEEGKVQLEMVNFDLHEVLADSMEILATTAAQKGIGKC